MTTQRSRLLAAVMVVVALLLGFGATPAHADEPTPPTTNNDLITHAKEFYTTYGVPQPVQARLRHGQLPDSEMGGAPSSVSTKTDAGKVITISTWPDGSIRVSQIDDTKGIKEAAVRAEESGMAKPSYGVEGCQYTSGGGYAGYWNHCTATEMNVYSVVWCSFDYSYTNGVGGYLGDLYGCGVNAWGGTVNAQWPERINDTQELYKYQFDGYGGLGSRTSWLTIWLDGPTAYSQLAN